MAVQSYSRKPLARIFRLNSQTGLALAQDAADKIHQKSGGANDKLRAVVATYHKRKASGQN